MTTGDTVSILDGNTFAVSDRAGNIDAWPAEPQGLFARDTRFLSRWILTVNGAPPSVLSTDDLRYDPVQFFLVMGTGTVHVDADVSIMRRRAVQAANAFGRGQIAVQRVPVVEPLTGEAADQGDRQALTASAWNETVSRPGAVPSTRP